MSFLEDHLGGGPWRDDPPFSSVTFEVRPLGAGDYRAGLELSAVIDRRDFGLDWQEALPDGGDSLGWNVALEALGEFVGQVQ